MKHKICLALTMGDPKGIGPEVLVKALGYHRYPGTRLLGVGDPKVFQRALRPLKGGKRLRLKIVCCPEQAGADPSKLWVYPESDALGCVRLAGEWALAGRVQGIVTAPLYKKAFRSFPGHTEYLAHLAGVKRVVMMLVGGGLRVALVTTHLPFRKILNALNPGTILETVKITGLSLQRFFGLPRPRIALASLNPHAGEGGLLGDEEKKLFPQVLKRSKLFRGLQVTGPYPPDVVFFQALQGRFDAVVALYHDQGLIALKTIAFNSGVNVTLGLPFIRTSPDHGTAREIAWKNIADYESMNQAILLAVDMAIKQREDSHDHRCS